MNLYRDQGIVLRTHKLGEADRIISILTQNSGKVRAVAKGVRRTKSKFGARLEPFTHVDLQLHRGRELDIVTQAEILSPFAGLRADFDRYVAGSTILEAVEKVAQERERAVRLFLLLLGALRTLDASEASPALVADAFLWKLLAAAGYQPSFETCARCGGPGLEGRFSMAGGGRTCLDCASGETYRVAETSLRLAARLLGADWPELAGMHPDPVERREASSLANAYAEYHLERRLRSRSVVGQLRQQ